MKISIMEFFINNVEEEEIRRKRILEVGSLYINGSVRPFIERLKPKQYIGIDIRSGRFVDIILPAEKLVECFGENSFDILISTELLEHVKNWRTVIISMKRVLKTEGYMYITTRSKGFPYHSFPADYWRFDVEDIFSIFSDFKIINVEEDWESPGVFLKAFKPTDYKEKDLSNNELYSQILGERTLSIPDINNMPILRRVRLIGSLNLQTIYNKILEFRQKSDSLLL